MFAWIERKVDRREFTVAATGTQSDEKGFGNCYPTRIFVQNTTGAPTSLGFSLESPVNTSNFEQLYSGGSALAITVTPGKWVEISDSIAKLLGAARVKVDCAAWSAGGKIWMDTAT